MADAMAIAVLETGKILADGVAEVREAVDYCSYYADRARAGFAEPADLPGSTGETNCIALHDRGGALRSGRRAVHDPELTQKNILSGAGGTGGECVAMELVVEAP